MFPGVSRWALNTIISGYMLQFVPRAPCFNGALASEIHAQNALVLRAEIHNLFAKGGRESELYCYASQPVTGALAGYHELAGDVQGGQVFFFEELSVKARFHGSFLSGMLLGSASTMVESMRPHAHLALKLNARLNDPRMLRGASPLDEYSSL